MSANRGHRNGNASGQTDIQPAPSNKFSISWRCAAADRHAEHELKTLLLGSYPGLDVSLKDTEQSEMLAVYGRNKRVKQNTHA